MYWGLESEGGELYSSQTITQSIKPHPIDPPTHTRSLARAYYLLHMGHPGGQVAAGRHGRLQPYKLFFLILLC